VNSIYLSPQHSDQERKRRARSSPRLCTLSIATSWEGFAIENLLSAAPERTSASFYRTAVGAEIDLLLEIPGHGLWAIEIKRSLSGRPEKGFYVACQDLQPDRRFVVNAGSERYPIDSETTAIGIDELAWILVSLAN